VKIGLEISTVDYFQGAEKDYVFASIVRCNDRGAIQFAESKSRLTVMLSRARKGLMIVGSTMTLQEGSRDNPWKDVIDILEQSHRVYHANPELDNLAISKYAAWKRMQDLKNRPRVSAYSLEQEWD
jgi:superfamily I DNA and/or RNA helicase